MGFTVINLNGYLAIREDDQISYIYCCALHKQFATNKQVEIYSRKTLGQYADVICPWIPLSCTDHDIKCQELEKTVDIDKFSCIPRQPLNESESEPEQLRYQGWQLYQFLGAVNPIDHSINGIWQRVRIDIEYILDDATPPPYVDGP